MNAQTILYIYLIFFIVEYLFRQILEFINIRYAGKQRSRGIPAALRHAVDEKTYNKSIEYTFAKTKFGVIEATFSTGFLLLVVLSGLFGGLDGLLLRADLPPRIRGILFIFSVSLLFSLFSLPFSAFSRFKIENSFGFNKMNAGLFFLDYIKGLVLSGVLFFILLYGLFFLVDVTGMYWWLFAFGMIALFQLIMTVLYPLVIAPIFNKFTPLEDGPLKERLNRLSEKLAFPARGIFVMDGSRRSSHSNAFFTGLGKAKRIVLYDTLLQQLEDHEIEAILAHEIGHEKKKHGLKMYFFSMVILAAGLYLLSRLLHWEPLFHAFGFTGPSIHGAVIIVSICLGPFTFLFKPLLSMWSRRYEYQADAFAVRSLGSAEGLNSGLIALARKNLSNPCPHPLFSFYHYSHPALLERIEKSSSFTG